MEVRGRIVVVTGGASGIGRALALRLAAEGARGVVVADLDAAGADAVAAEIGPSGVGVRCDVTAEADITHLIERAEVAFGPVDVFCSNAGIAQPGDIHAPDEQWRRTLEVNLHSHVLAARRLVPGWLQRGEGYFLMTASAAGLLTQIGSAQYAVSKHAAVALAEWLAITYGRRGLRVSCLCPMGVDTPLLHDLGAGDGVATRAVAGAGAVLDPSDVAEAVVDGIRHERFLILSHPEVLEFFRRKASDYDRWIAGMQRLQDRVT